MLRSYHSNCIRFLIPCRLRSAVAWCVVAVLLASCGSLQAQQKIESRPKHQQIRGDLAPGVAAYRSQLQNRKLIGHTQPVRIITPLGSRISVWSGKGFSPTGTSKATFGMQIGPVYRMKVEDIPNRVGKEIFPSIEVVNRLQPPQGLEHKFPIEVAITQDDLEQAAAGRFVTKVIYLEDPESAPPVRQVQDDQRYFDVGPGEDPYRTADGLGRPMAIVRIGSRAPIAGDQTDQFGFDNPTPVMMSEFSAPKVTPAREKNWQSLDGDLVDPPVPPMQNGIPPIIPGEVYNGGN